MAMATTSTTELLTEQVLNILVRPLEDVSRFLAAGPRIFDTAGPLRIPKMGAATNPQWHGENEQISEVEPDFDELHLLPSTMKSIKTLTRYSNELSRQSVISLDAVIKDRLVKDVADVMDKQLFSDSGDGSTMPKGLFAYQGTQEIAVGGTLTLDHLLDAQALALAANVNLAGTRWIMSSDEFVKLRKLKDTAGRYIIEPDVAQAGTYRLFGSPVLIVNRLPEGSAALVDFSQIAVARDLNPSVKLLDQTFADHDQQAIRVVMRLDAAPLNPEAIIKLTGIGA